MEPTPTHIEACTRGIRVRVRSQYAPEGSRPELGLWLFVYEIQIRNEGAETVQLRARHWYIEDATGRCEEVRGKGVVGEQPVLEPGTDFSYTSQCQLTTPYGSMRGSYLMVSSSDDEFQAEIPRFDLIQAGAIH